MIRVPLPRTVGAAAVSIALIIMLGLQLLDPEQVVLDEGVRAASPGSFVELSDGIVHYDLEGDSDAPTVVLIPGDIGGYWWFDEAAGVLSEAGLRVLRYDLYGRWLSDRPSARYNEDLFLRQLSELLEAVGVTEPIHLVAASLGGGVAVAFAERFPDRVDRLVLHSPAGASPSVERDFRLFRVPILGNLALRLLSRKIVERFPEINFSSTERIDVDRVVGLVEQEISLKGWRRAHLSSWRELPPNILDKYTSVGRHEREVLLIWGRDDRVLPFEDHESILQAMPGASFLPVADAGHAAVYERGEEVLPEIVRFLTQSD